MATRLTLEMPEHALDRLMEGYRSGDPTLMGIFEEFGVIAISPHDEHALAQWESEGGSAV
jgi:hypothetical protein